MSITNVEDKVYNEHVFLRLNNNNNNNNNDDLKLLIGSSGNDESVFRMWCKCTQNAKENIPC